MKGSATSTSSSVKSLQSKVIKEAFWNQSFKTTQHSQQWPVQFSELHCHWIEAPPIRYRIDSQNLLLKWAYKWAKQNLHVSLSVCCRFDTERIIENQVEHWFMHKEQKHLFAIAYFHHLCGMLTLRLMKTMIHISYPFTTWVSRESSRHRNHGSFSFPFGPIRFNWLRRQLDSIVFASDQLSIYDNSWIVSFPLW